MNKPTQSVLCAIAAYPLFAAIAYTAMLSACDNATSTTAPESTASSSSTTTTIEEQSSSETATVEPSSSAIQQSSSSSGQKQFSSSSRSSHRRSSSSAVQTSSSAISSSQETPVSSSSDVAKSSSSSQTSLPAKEISLDENGFATVADVYKSLTADEKAVFIIRHSEREDNVAIETELTANGVKMAQNLGTTLKSDEEFSYITSGLSLIHI